MDESGREGPIKIGDVVTAVVEDVLPFGVFVRLSDGNRAFIRPREISLSGAFASDKSPAVASMITAKVMALGTSDQLAEVSIRAALPDPWPTFARRYRTGDIVAGVVRHLTQHGAFVEIVPGVDGFVPAGELTLGRSIPHPEEVLWPGDHTEALITALDAGSHRLRLSIRRWIERLAQTASIVEGLHLEDGAEAELVAGVDSGTPDRLEPISLEGTVLVVEDQDSVRMPLVEWLEVHHCAAHGAASARQALALCALHSYVFVIVDLDMPELDGVGFLRQLRSLGGALPAAVMSGPDLIAERLPELRGLGVVAGFAKPLDPEEIYQVLLELGQGKPLSASLESYSQMLPPPIEDFQHLRGIMRGSGQLTERLKKGLGRLVENVRADLGVVFHMDIASRTVSIVVESGHSGFDMKMLYGFADSPVGDVILRGQLLWEARASTERNRLRILLDALPFESCIGIPLEAGGHIEYGLFLFANREDAFPSYRLRDAQATAQVFDAALEGQLLEERIQSVSRILLSGQLASAFGHEVYNKVSGLDLQFGIVRASFDRTAGAESAAPADWEQLHEALLQAGAITTDLRRTVDDFQRLMRVSDDHSVDVNQVLLAAKAQIVPLAQRRQIRLRTALAGDLVPATGNSIRLQQVFLNLMLNAIQHMGSQSEGKSRVLELATNLVTAGELPRVQIRFADTGPGVHRQLWEKIFSLGFTTREGGSGLGLYIAKSLVESMQGKILIEKSLVPLGSTFLVELPLAPPTREPSGAA